MFWNLFSVNQVPVQTRDDFFYANTNTVQSVLSVVDEERRMFLHGNRRSRFQKKEEPQKRFPLERLSYDLLADPVLALVIQGGCLCHDFIRNALDVRVAGQVVVLEPVADELLVVAGWACSNFVFSKIPETA